MLGFSKAKKYNGGQANQVVCLLFQDRDFYELFGIGKACLTGTWCNSCRRPDVQIAIANYLSTKHYIDNRFRVGMQ